MIKVGKIRDTFEYVSEVYPYIDGTDPANPVFISYIHQVPDFEQPFSVMEWIDATADESWEEYNEDEEHIEYKLYIPDSINTFEVINYRETIIVIPPESVKKYYTVEEYEEFKWSKISYPLTRIS